MTFVTFNKVCTSQVSGHDNSLNSVTDDTIKAIWLGIAYRLELLGQSVYLWVWAASILFLVSNAFVLGELIAAYDYQSTRT
ncbi:GPI mannosyltransferase 1 [Rhizoctonia solani]